MKVFATFFLFGKSFHNSKHINEDNNKHISKHNSKHITADKWGQMNSSHGHVYKLTCIDSFKFQR